MADPTAPVSASQTPHPQGRKGLILLLATIAAIGPLGINIYLPSMPSMARLLEVDYAAIQLTLSIYLAAVAIGQLVVGPLSDRFGRRPLLLLGLSIYLVGCIVCSLAENLTWFAWGRVIQALGGCAGMALTRTIVRDLYDRNQAASVIGYVAMGMTVAPMVAPVVGGFLETVYGWRASFLFLFVFAAPIVVITWLRLPETNAFVLSQRQAVVGSDAMPAAAPIAFWRSYPVLFKTRAFWGYALTTGFASGVFFAFVAGGAYVMIELLGRSPVEYGLYFAAVTVGYMVGNFLSGRYAARVGADRMISIGSLLGLGSVLSMVVVFGVLEVHHPMALFLPTIFVAVGNGLTIPSSLAGAVSVRPDIAGAASGLVGSLQMGIAAVIAPLVGWLLSDTAWPLLLVMLGTSSLALVCYRIIR